MLPAFRLFPLTLTFFDTSSDYNVHVDWPGTGSDFIYDFGSSAYYTAFWPLPSWLPPVKDSSGWYWTLKFEIDDQPGDPIDWIEVYIFLDPEGNLSHAAAYDSDGNWYDVSLTVE